MFYFDSHGWLAPSGALDRSTGIDPEFVGDPVVGQPYPNCIGKNMGWVLVPYDIPVTDTRPAQRAAIIAELDAVQTMNTRTLFETLGGDKTQWLKIKAKADALRDELKKLG